jgi:CubicO group peptidase (beta-lactamase class C family)
MRLRLLALFFLPLSLQAQLSQSTDLKSSGVSAERLDRIDSFVQRYINAERLNGAVGLILKDGKIIYNKSFGYSNIGKKTPMQNDNIFRIASMTKPVVTVAVMMLWEEGRFSLEDPISKFIPEFKDPKVLDRFNSNDTTFTTQPSKREITIRQLLNHTSGIGYPQIGSAFATAIYKKYNINGGIGTPESSLSEMIPRLAKLPLFNQPGEKFLYGLNTDVLGYLVEVISGMPLDKFLQQRIFAPLGMQDTYFFLPADKASRLVPMYKLNDKNKAELYTSRFSNGGDPNFPLAPKGSYFSGGAGLSSTAYDYALFSQMLLNGGVLEGVRLLSPHTVKLMTMNQVGEYPLFDNPTDIRRFGLGFGLYLENAKTGIPVGEGTFMWDGMYASHFWIDPKNKLVVVFMRNIWPTADWDFVDRIKPVIYQALTN